MKKFATLILTTLILATTIPTPVSNAKFFDVPTTHTNYTAITSLKNYGIIEGYSDGTFKPEQNVNRAEFLKIILEGSEIILDQTQNTSFPDVNHNEWYAPYIKKAYTEGWIEGYPDGTFKPDQTINKVEAIKILGEVQNWALAPSITTLPFEDTPASAWYTKYISYAKDLNYLEETGVTYEPDTQMTRANISEVIYRTTDPENPPQAPSQTTPAEPLTPTTTPEQTEIPKDFYAEISLDTPLPTVFYKNEIYIIKGEIISNSSTSYTTATALLDPDNEKSDDFITFYTPVENNKFEFQIYFKETGNYLFGIMPGETGQTKIEEIAVMPELPTPTLSSQSTTIENPITSFLINFENDKTFVNFATSTSTSTPTATTIKKLTLEQDNQKVTYLSRQNTDQITIDYKDFENFTEKTVSYFIETATLASENPLEITSDFTKTTTKIFTATQHHFSEIVEEEIFASPPETLSSIQTISFPGSTKVETQLQAYIIKPDGFTDQITLSTTAQTSTYYETEIIPANKSFTFQYSPSTEGTYIIEIIDKGGLPLVNSPIYIGNKSPLIPDYFDSNERTFFTGTILLPQLRIELLNLINTERKNHGLAEVTMSEELNNLAQIHSTNMAENLYFSHVDLDGITPDERRIEAGIKTPVAENIAKDVTITFAHHGLMRSAIHRENILDENWAKVGIGIALDKNGYILVSEEFSADDVNEEDLLTFKNELINAINTARNENGTTTILYSETLESASKYMNDKIIQLEQDPTNEIFQEALEEYKITGKMQAIIRSYNIWPEILSSIIEEENSLLQDPWEKMGIDLQLDKIGIIHTTLIINQL